MYNMSGGGRDQPVASHVELLSVFVFFDAVHHAPIRYTHCLYQGSEILHVKVAVRASMSLAGSGGMLSQDLLTAKRAVAATAAVRVTTHIAVYVPHIVAVFLVKRVVCDLVEASPPEYQALLEIEAYPLEEEGVL